MYVSPRVVGTLAELEVQRSRTLSSGNAGRS